MCGGSRVPAQAAVSSASSSSAAPGRPCAAPEAFDCDPGDACDDVSPRFEPPARGGRGSTLREDREFRRILIFPRQSSLRTAAGDPTVKESLSSLFVLPRAAAAGVAAAARRPTRSPLKGSARRTGSARVRGLHVMRRSTMPALNAPDIDLSAPDSLPHACTRRAVDHARRGRRPDPMSPTRQDSTGGLIAGRRGGAHHSVPERHEVRPHHHSSRAERPPRPPANDRARGEHGDLEARHHQREVGGSAATPPPGFGSWDVIQRLCRTQRGWVASRHRFLRSDVRREASGP